MLNEVLTGTLRKVFLSSFHRSGHWGLEKLSKPSVLNHTGKRVQIITQVFLNWNGLFSIPLHSSSKWKRKPETWENWKDSSSNLAKVVPWKKVTVPIVQNRKHRKQKIVINNQHSVGTKDHACPTSHLLPPDLTVLPLILIITPGCQHLMTSLWKPQRTTVSETGELTRPGRKRNQLAGSGAYLKTQSL